jgi:hypothetical protein
MESEKNMEEVEREQDWQGLDARSSGMMAAFGPSHPCQACFPGARRLIAPAFRHTLAV